MPITKRQLISAIESLPDDAPIRIGIWLEGGNVFRAFEVDMIDAEWDDPKRAATLEMCWEDRTETGDMSYKWLDEKYART